MKPYMNFKGKGLFSYSFGDKVPKKYKRNFAKSTRQEGKKIVIKDKSE